MNRAGLVSGASFSVLISSLALLPVAVQVPGRQTADLVVVNGKVWTVDPARPRAEAVALSGEHIVAVGSSAKIRKWAGPKTRTVDAQGKSVLPGFIDAHVHLSSGGDRSVGHGPLRHRTGKN